jgi:hypothetical protein
LIRAEKAITALRNAKETLSDGLIIAMILKGLPDNYKPFAIHVTQSASEITFAHFKSMLRSFEETEKFHAKPIVEQIMKAEAPSLQTMTCYGCGKAGHLVRDCPGKSVKTSKWCSYHKSTTHTDSTCKSQQKNKDQAKRVSEKVKDNKEEEHSFAFTVQDQATGSVNQRGMLVDTGATSHIVTSDILKRVDQTFKPSKHFIELADGTRASNIALKRGDAEVLLQDASGNQVKAVLKNALYIPSYPQDIFSVKAATSDGAELRFGQNSGELILQDGNIIKIEEHGRLYYLNCSVNSSPSNVDQINLSYDVNTWHEILGHCNFEDLVKLQGLVEGMNISGKLEPSKLICNTCIEGKFVNSRSRKPDARAQKPLEKVHVDLAGPITPVSREGFKYCIAFTDDFSGAVFVYFLKSKSDTSVATEKFLADVSPYGKVNCIRSDNGSEFTGKAFQTLLRERGIKHETSAPYSPHQNGTAERHWRTLFEMGRCLILQSGLPKTIWPYAIQTAAHIRNRCYNRRTKTTPYFSLTGIVPDLSRMWIFGSECFAYEQEHKKLDSRCSKGLFVGYDKNSPSYLVYYPKNGKVMKHRLVKFVKNNSVEQYTQTDEFGEDSSVCERNDSDSTSSEESNPQESVDHSDLSIPTNNTTPNEYNLESESLLEDHNDNESVEYESETKRYPRRERNPPEYLGQHEVNAQNNDLTNVNVDHCYKVCGMPQNYTEAMGSPQAREWEQAMKEEINSLQENDTFELSELPRGKASVGGKWVYTTKQNQDGIVSFKARYVAKGYNQVKGIDYEETFAPTANITSIRVLMQLAVNHDLVVHQMDVKTAYLHAPIDQEIYIDQPQGFEEVAENGSKLVYRLKKSLYGLKQSGRNWNKVLHEHLERCSFIRNPADHCVYKKQVGDKIIIVVVWVDDLVIASNSMKLMEEFKTSMKSQFRMKDLGAITSFLGIDFKQSQGEIKMNQSRFILKILERFGMTDCKPRSTPCEQRFESTGVQMSEGRQYREIVGSLIYIMTCTRPDLSWIVSKLSQTLSNPKEGDLVAAKHVLRYLKGSINYEICFTKSNAELQVLAYSDSDWASCLEDRRSTTGYCCTLNEKGPMISWKSKKQPTVALSSCEAEYVALANTAQECVYLTQLLNGMTVNGCQKIKISVDNQGAISLSKNPVNRQRSKHIDIKYHFVRDLYTKGVLDITYCPTEDMVADVLTKPPTKFKLEKFKEQFLG